MNRWMARQPDRQMNGWTDSRKDGRTKGRREGQERTEGGKVREER